MKIRLKRVPAIDIGLGQANKERVRFFQTDAIVASFLGNKDASFLLSSSQVPELHSKFLESASETRILNTETLRNFYKKS